MDVDDGPTLCGCCVEGVLGIRGLLAADDAALDLIHLQFRRAPIPYLDCHLRLKGAVSCIKIGTKLDETDTQEHMQRRGTVDAAKDSLARYYAAPTYLPGCDQGRPSATALEHLKPRLQLTW